MNEVEEEYRLLMVELLKKGAYNQKYGGLGMSLMFLFLLLFATLRTGISWGTLLLIPVIFFLILFYLGLKWGGEEKLKYANIFENRDFDKALEIIKNGPKTSGKYPIRKMFELWIALESEDWKGSNEIINSFDFRWWIKGDFLSRRFEPIKEGISKNLRE
jgi:hypothetical protein